MTFSDFGSPLDTCQPQVRPQLDADRLQKRTPKGFNFDAFFKPTRSTTETPTSFLRKDQQSAGETNHDVASNHVPHNASISNTLEASTSTWNMVPPFSARQSVSVLGVPPNSHSIDLRAMIHVHSVQLAGISESLKNSISEQAWKLECSSIDLNYSPLGHQAVVTFHDSRNTLRFLSNINSNPWMKGVTCSPLHGGAVDAIAFNVSNALIPQILDKLRQVLETFGDIAHLRSDSSDLSGKLSQPLPLSQGTLICKFYDTRVTADVLAAGAINVMGMMILPKHVTVSSESLQGFSALRGRCNVSPFPSTMHSINLTSPLSLQKTDSQSLSHPPSLKDNKFLYTQLNDHRSSSFQRSMSSINCSRSTNPSLPHHPPTQTTWSDPIPVNVPLSSSVYSSSVSTCSESSNFSSSPTYNNSGNSVAKSNSLTGGSVSSMDSLSSISSMSSTDRENTGNSRKEVLDLFKKFDAGRSQAPLATARKNEKVSVPRMPYNKWQTGNDSSAEYKQTCIDLDAISRGVEKRCTVMVRNIPNKLGFEDFKKFIDATSKHEYDFLYLRFDFANRCNVGYAFVSFTNSDNVKKFVEKRSGMKWNQHHHNSGKVIELRYAKIQGHDNLIEKFRNSPVMSQEQSFRPRFYHTSGPLIGEEIDFTNA